MQPSTTSNTHPHQTNEPTTSYYSSPQIPANNEQQQPLSRINLRQLRQKNRQTQNVIKSIQTKITYMKNKQEKTVKRVLNIKRKLTSLEDVRSKTRQIKQKYHQEKKKHQQQTLKKTEFNKLIKDHLNYNKKIVLTLMNHKTSEEVKNFKEKNHKLQLLHQVQKQNSIETNVQKANKVRMDHIEAHQRRKLYFLEKLHQFKQLKQEKLKQQMRERQRQQQMIFDLEQKEKMLLQRLSVSQKFRIKCQQEYQQARKKYKSFYQASRGLNNRGHRSCNESRITEGNYEEGKADIFIS